MGEEEYQVQDIIAKRHNPKTGTVEYRVKWKGYSIREATWQPIQHLQITPGLIQEYQENLQKESISHPQPIKGKQVKKESKSKLKEKKQSEGEGQSSSSQAPGDDLSKLKGHRPVSKVKSKLKKQQQKSERRVTMREEVVIEEDPEEDYGDSPDDQPSCTFSWESDEQVEVLQMAVTNTDQWYFQMRFPFEIRWMSHAAMKRQFAYELATFYEKQIRQEQA